MGEPVVPGGSATLESVLHYRLDTVLGGGGMGMVYRAVDTRLDRTVALKFLADELVGAAEARERLLVEARLAARLDHPNIGTVFAIEETPEGQLFLSMALYQGETLEQRLEQGPLPWRDALEVARQILQALRHAHDHGIIHRDVKPGNIVLTEQGPKLLDFGLATLRDSKGLAEGATGTVGYMSPEQVRGQPLVDAKTDLWSFSVVLYEMLTGVAPFGGGGVAGTILDILSRDPAPVASLRPDVPKAIDSVLRVALAKDPAQRYGNASEMLDDLDATVRGVEPSARNPRGPRGIRESATSMSNDPMSNERVSNDPAPNNLVLPKTPLVGRRDERALIARYLADDDCHAITLLGFGGVGKTRLALQSASEQVDSGRFGRGVFFVALDGLDQVELIASSVADAFGVELHPLEDDADQIVAAVGEDPALLVLDNFEHLMDGTPLVRTLVRSCPNLKLLVTSRERLQLAEEYVVPLQGLPYPDTDVPLDEALDFEAVELFVQRARQGDRDFALDETNLHDVLEICRLVFGSPLGLELAAAWTRMLEPGEIVAEIRSDDDFLSTGSRTVTERHRSIRAVFEYSWHLLDPAEQGALAALSVFRGGATREAAARVAGAKLALLSQLADKSLLTRTAAGTFEQHGMLQQYARQKLAAEPEREERILAAHARYFLEFVSTQSAAMHEDRVAALERIEASLDNIRAGWRHATLAFPQQLKQTADGMRRFFDERNLLRDGVELFGQTLDELGDGSDTAAVVAVHLAWLRLRQGDFEQAIELCRRGLAQLGSDEDRRTLQLGCNTMGAALASKGEYGAARPQFEAALEAAVALGDDGARITALENLAQVAQQLGDFELARRDFEQGLELARRLDHDRQRVSILNNLASLLLSMGEPAAAEPLLREGVELAEGAGLKQILPFFLANLGLAASARGDHRAGKRFLLDALKLLRGSSQRSFEAALLAELGRAAVGLGEVDEGERYFRRSLQIALDIEAPPLALHVVTLAGLARIEHGRDGAADLLRLVVDHPATQGEDRALAEGGLKRLPTASGGAIADFDDVLALLDDAISSA